MGNITATEIERAYRKAFKMSFWAWIRSAGIFQFADEFYREADEELIRMIMDADAGEREQYETEFYDCDDFAFSLMGVFHKDREAAAMPIFITWVDTPVGGHALLSYYYKGQVKMIEPQRDGIFDVPPSWRLQLLCG